MLPDGSDGLRIGIEASNLRRGGGVTHLVEVLAALDPAVHGIDRVIVWGGRATLDRLAPKRGMELVHEPAIDRSLLSRLQWQRHTLTRRVQEAGCDVLFVPGGLYTGGFTPFVTMSRNLLPFDPIERARFGRSRTRLRYHLLEYSQTKTFRRAAGVLFLTEAHRQAVLQRTGALPGETAVIPHGVSDAFARAPRPARPLSAYTRAAPFRWLYVSIINYYKHQEHVADAVARLRRAGYPLALDLVGPAYPPALAQLQHTLQQLDPERDFIQYHGPVPHETLGTYYEAADGFVFASSCETFGQILTEAMQAGLPIACARRSALPEVLQDAGLYFDPEQPASIAEALRRLMDAPALRAHYAAQAAARAQTFTWARCAQDTFAFITRQARHAADARVHPR